MTTISTPIQAGSAKCTVRDLTAVDSHTVSAKWLVGHNSVPEVFWHITN